jgi:pimeloyl-ACP methyl ester carboxylesterase
MQLFRPSPAMRLIQFLAVAVLATACGGGGGDEGHGPPPMSDPVGAGQLESAALLNTIPVSDIVQALGGNGLGLPGSSPRYAVKSYRIRYLTTDALGKPVHASGLVSVPQKAAGAKSPLLSYQHATTFHDAEAPSNHATPDDVSVVLASLGFIVVAPDFVGYGASMGTPHPYLLSAPSAHATLDFLTATGTWRHDNNVADNGQLFMTGYSEGAYVTMAAHRELQAQNAAPLASLRMVVTGAGPYDVQATFDGLEAEVRAQSPVLGALIDPGLLRFLSPSARTQVRNAILSQLVPSDADVVLDTQAIDNYMADNVQAIAQQSSVYDWKPNVPVFLFHGPQDQTVPYASSLTTLQAMQARGAGSLVSLTNCTAVPSGHIPCVPSFLAFMLTHFAAVATDL